MRRCALVLVVGGLVWGASPAPASALNPLGALCSATGVVSKAARVGCAIAKHAGTLIKVGKRLVSGRVGSAVGAASAAAGESSATVALVAMGVWVLGGAKFALDETAKVLGATTRPQLNSTWFSGTYWRMAGIAAVLTLPFLFAAAVQALVRSDLALLARAACMYLPLAVLAVSIAAPLTMLALAASDELSALVSGATGHESTHFLSAASLTIGALSTLRSPFLAFLVGAFTVVGALALWVELLMREAAVYVIVLMLPLTFASFVWPARRIWAVRMVELLFALILSKFAIVAVLSLGGAALNTTLGTASVVNWLAGLVLVVLAAFMPWALLRFVPMAEAASGAAGSLRGELRGLLGPAKVTDIAARAGDEWVASVTADMRRQAESMRRADAGADRAVAPAAPRDAASERQPGEAEPAGEPDVVPGAGEDGAMPTGEPDLVPGAGGGGAALTGEPDLAQVAGEDGVAPAAQPDLGSDAEPGTAPTAAATRQPSQEGAAGESEPADWKPDIMQAPNQSRVVILDTGETEPARDRAARSPRPIAPDDPGGADTADDPDPLPPPQDQPEGQL